MNSEDERRSSGEGLPKAGSAKRPWVTPRLERFGTIADLTRGAGQNDIMDGGHPPGQNKSIFN